MGLSYEAAANLFRQGEFLRLIDASGHDHQQRRTLEPRHRVIIANALAVVGDLREAQYLAHLDRHPPSAAAVRSQAESTLAILSWRDGELSSALRHAQSAIQLAQESDDLERIAWAHLHRFRLLIDTGPMDKVLAALLDARKVVARAGIGQATAYLHTSVSVLEGQTGRVDEARRHCDIAESLLEVSPNIWLTGASLINRGCLACLNCDFDEAIDLLRAGQEAARKSGQSHLALATDATMGYVQFLVGQFDTAKETLHAVLHDRRVGVPSKLGASDSLARVIIYLTQVIHSAILRSWQPTSSPKPCSRPSSTSASPIPVWLKWSSFAGRMAS